MILFDDIVIAWSLNRDRTLLSIDWQRYNYRREFELYITSDTRAISEDANI